MNTRLAASGLAMVMSLGCDREDFVEPLPDVVEPTLGADGTELVTFRDVVDNGVSGNGYRWNGYRWNGYRWNGYRWNGYRWNGVELNAATVSNVRWDAATGSLAADDAQSNAVALAPTDELLAVGDYDVGTGVIESETLISEVEQVTGGTHPFQFQRVQTRVLPSGTWEDACRDGAGNPTKAILLKGDWSSPQYTRIAGAGAEQATTWACRGAALAKCVEWGYHPEGSVGATPLADHHQACTRMVRADYCGTGEHHTENGTLIDVEDSLAIQTHETEWDIEAAWGSSGALCLNEPRKTYWSRSVALSDCSSVPSCDANGNADLTDDTAHWLAQGALFVTRATPTALSTAEPAPADSGG